MVKSKFIKRNKNNRCKDLASLWCSYLQRKNREDKVLFTAEDVY